MKDQKLSTRQIQYDFERRYEYEDQLIQKKKIMTGREYDDFIQNQKDENLKTVKIFRTSFMYEN